MRLAACIQPALTALAILFGLGLGAPVPASPAAPDEDLGELARRLVGAYHAGDLEALRPHLAPEMGSSPFPGNDQQIGDFLEVVRTMGEGDRDRELEITWTGVTGALADVRGTWSWTNVETGRTTRLVLSIELEFDTSGDTPRVLAWRNDFRRRAMWKPAAGDRELSTEHFRIVYFDSELGEQSAKRLGETLEKWYGETSRYLGRSLDADRRVHINVADCHDSPFASDPGPDAFILVSSRSSDSSPATRRPPQRSTAGT